MPTVASMQGLLFFNFTFFFGRRRVGNNCDYVICGSDTTVEHIKKSFSYKIREVIHSCITF